MKTYADFIASRIAVDNCHDYNESARNVPGYIYFDSFYIEFKGRSYYTMVTIDEMDCTQLEPVEKFLWDNWVEGECNTTGDTK